MVSLTQFGSKTVPAEEWDEFVEALDGIEDLQCVVGVSQGAVSLSSTQRKRVADALAKSGGKSVVLTDDRMVRGIATAVSWLGINVVAFRWSQLDEAMTATGAPPAIADEMAKSILEFRDRQGS
ncbi:hypothetical protein G6O69_03575 [Pseudenhygromyxa sp. WMMC2535]|uniref:hypothetical protein n=1 Tax=Pseudenhygromyxa sp. WMMC2535 TaxID=2712867 RepID=UPI0015952442|nr:hypothetical protein [Pseudenhygromyxa sp. WMMC2535]NVB36895.1 hypothetical protein [Pseudenhygromyxa sp. WMMC2535]